MSQTQQKGSLAGSEAECSTARNVEPQIDTTGNRPGIGKGQNLKYELELARNMTHKQMQEAVEMRVISYHTLSAEMTRRKARKKAKCKFLKKQSFVMEPSGETFTIEVPSTRLAERMLNLPLCKNDLRKMLEHREHGPFWRAKIEEILLLPADIVADRLEQAIYSPFKKGTVAYWEDLLWGSRRCRDNFLKVMLTDSEPVVQGDEPVLEETSSMAGSGNITFVEERETDQDASHINSSLSTRDTMMNMAEAPWSSIQSILTREIIIRRGEWTETTPAQFLSLGIPKCIIEAGKTFIRRQLETVAFLRAGVEFRIQFNGNKFSAGSMIFAILPPMFDEDTDNYLPVQCFNFPHVRFDAAVSNVGTLFVPFTHILSHFPQRAGTLESDSIVTLGRLVGYIINPLKVGEGAVNTLSYTIYAHFVNPELHQTTWPFDEFAYSDGIITQGEEGLFKKIIGGGLSTALGAFLSKMTGGLATGIGSFLSGLIFDYPRDPVPAVPMLNHSVGPLSYGAGIDHSIRLALCPISETETTPDLIGSTNGDFDLRTLLQIPSLLEVSEWSSTDLPGHELFAMPVTPVYIPASRVDGSQNTTFYTPTMQAYISRAFCYWRGSLKLKIQVVKTEFNNGRILVAYTPHITSDQLPQGSEPEMLNYFNQSNVVVFDVEEQKEFVVDLPYMSPRPWLRCDALRTAVSYTPDDVEDDYNHIQSFLSESYCGFVKVMVLNKLVSPSNVTQTVQLNFFLSVGDDFELAYPTSLSPLNIASYRTVVTGAYEEYPFLLGNKRPIAYEVNFENRDWITAAYHDGLRLFREAKILNVASKKWYDCVPKDYVGTTDEEVLSWCYRASIIEKYISLESGETNVQGRFISLLPDYNDATPALASTQGLEEYTSNRVKEPPAIVSTSGKRTAEAAPATVSENAMNMQTILRRFYCIYNSVPLYHLTNYTLITIPVNPSVTPVARQPIITSTGTYFGESVPTDQIAWFVKLYTYWRGSLRYKIVFDESAFDVEVVHVPTDCKPFQVLRGIKESDITRITSYASAIAVSQVQGSLEVEVPYASPYVQNFIDVHNKYYDLRCQNGTLFVFFRNKMKGNVESKHPMTLQIFRSTGEDFVLNVPRAPPKICEPNVLVGYCDGQTQAVNVSFPEAVKFLGNESHTTVLPGSTGMKKIDNAGYMGYCVPKKPALADPLAVTQGFSDIAEAARKAPAVIEKFNDIVESGAVDRIVSGLDHTQRQLSELSTNINSAVDGNVLQNTLQNLNGISRKIDDMLKATTSTASRLTNQESITKYAIIASEVVLCGTFVHHVRVTLQEPTLPNFITLGLEFGLIVGLTASEALQSLIARVVDWAMNMKVLPELAQTQALDGVTDFLDENCSIVCSVVAVLGTVLYAYLFDALPSFDKIKSCIKSFFEDDDEASTQGIEKSLGFSLKNAHFSLLGISALEKVYVKITEWMKKLVFWFLDRENPEVVLARAATEVKDRVLALIKELDELDYEPTFIAALADPLVHNRFYRLQDEVNELTRQCTESKIDQKVVVLMAECRRRAQVLIKRMEKEKCTSTQRYDPFVVCLHGDTGVGKTQFASKIVEIYQRVMGLSQYHLMYTKNIRDDYWSGYTNQPLIFWDEFGQSRDADKVAIPEFMTFRGDKPVKLNMAALEDKGRDFTSQGIILTTNVPYQNYDSIRDNTAFKRRRHVMIGMQHRRGFDANALQDARHDAYPNWEHCSFALTHNITGNIETPNMTMQEVLAIVEERMTRWHNKQLAKLAGESYEELPRGIVPLTPPASLVAEMEAVEDDVYSETSSVAVEEEEIDEDQYFEFDDFVANIQDGVEDREMVELPRAQATESQISAFFDIDYSDLSQEEIFLAEAFLARAESLSPRQLVRRYRNVKATVKSTSSRLYRLASNTFNSAIDIVKNFWNNNPKLCKILGVVTLLSGVGAIMHFRTKAETEHYESGIKRPTAKRVIAESSYQSGPQKPSKNRVIPESSYSSGPQKASKVRVISEGSEDPQAQEISRKVKQYVYPIFWSKDANRKARMSCVHIGGHLIVAPYHFFNHAIQGDTFTLEHRVNPVTIEYQPSKLNRLEERDWVVYDCGVRLEMGKQLLKFFCDEQSLGKVSAAPCMLITRDPVDWDIEIRCGQCKPIQEFRYKDHNWGDVYAQKGFQHNIDTQAGHCGSPMMVCSNAMTAPGKIGGIHVAGFTDKAVGYVVLITRQMLERAIAPFQMPGAAVVPQCVEIGLKPGMRIVPEGDFTIVGKMPDQMSPSQPLKTTLIKTPFYEEVVEELGPAPKAPAALRQFEKDGVRVSPLKNAIVKYGHQTKPFPARNINKVKQYLICHLDSKLKHHTGKRVFTIPEAVNGLPGVEFAERMNMKSSPGWPYQMESKQPGKWHYFDEFGNIVDPKLTLRLVERERAAKILERVPSIWRDCLKDELRPLEKVANGKTRLFTIAPIDFTILTRQYFLDFVMAFYGAQGDNFFSAVGINPESPDWTLLYNYLAEFNTSVTAGDYECYDGKVMPELMEAVCEIINAWYGDSQENQNVRSTLFKEMIHTMQLCENTVYMTHQGNPSGNPLTTIINTIVNIILMILVWLAIFPHLSVDDFFQNVRFIGYGDDNMLAIKEKYVEQFNQKTIAEVLAQYGIGYTTDAKDGVDVGIKRPITEVTFLKRGFRKDAEFGSSFILPTMSKTTLHSYLYYVHSSSNLQEQLHENQRSALIFAAFYGREFYSEYLNLWQRMMKSVNMEPLHVSFEEQVDAFHYASGILSQKPKTTRNEKGPILEGMEGFMKFTNSKPVRSVCGVIEAPFYYLSAALGIMSSERTQEAEDDRWAIAIPSGEGKSTLAKNYPWLFVDHDDLLQPVYKDKKLLDHPWKAEVAREYDFPENDRRVLLVHHPNNTKRRLVGSYITPFPTFIRANCIQRLLLNRPTKMNFQERNILLVQLCSNLEPSLAKNKRSTLM